MHGLRDGNIERIPDPSSRQPKALCGDVSPVRSRLPSTDASVSDPAEPYLYGPRGDTHLPNAHHPRRFLISRPSQPRASLLFSRRIWLAPPTRLPTRPPLLLPLPFSGGGRLGSFFSSPFLRYGSRTQNERPRRRRGTIALCFGICSVDRPQARSTEQIERASRFVRDCRKQHC